MKFNLTWQKKILCLQLWLVNGDIMLESHMLDPVTKNLLCVMVDRDGMERVHFTHMDLAICRDLM
ncbi:MAG: hypothetical protein CME98_09385 [Hyphomonas sp.]|nr:hypothetical protein [Hyphomonas sp.]